MNNPSGEICVCGNWNSGPAAIMSFVGLETNTEKPFSWDWDADNPLTIAAHTYPTTTTTTTTPTTFLLDQARHDGGFGGGQFSSTGNLLYPQIPAGLNGSDSDYGGLVKREDGFGGNYQSGRIGLNLGHRTYFSSQENAVINRMFRRSRGFLQPQSQIPRCQAEGCKMDLSNAKHYHRRHKVCEFHSKATRVITGGLEQRFCQQCSRFHVLAEFDEVKRSCRKRLADHNRRRRKPQPGAETAGSKSAETSLENGRQIGKGTRDVTSQVGSVSRPELKTTSPSPSLPLMINSNSKAHQHKQYLQQGPAFLSLGGVETTNSGSNICNQEPFILNRSTQQPLSASSHNLLSSFRDIPLDLSPLMIASSCRVAISHHNLFYSSNQASQSTAGSDQSEQEIQYLRKFGQSIFEAEQI